MKYLKKLGVFVGLMCLLVGGVSGQIKIGDIEIPEKMAKEYFLDLYTKPDTVNAGDLIMNKGWFSPSKVIWSERKKRIIKIIYNCSDWKEKGHPNEESFIRRIKGEGGFDLGILERIFCIIPREPSASDFAKWMRKRYERK